MPLTGRAYSAGPAVLCHQRRGVRPGGAHAAAGAALLLRVRQRGRRTTDLADRFVPTVAAPNPCEFVGFHSGGVPDPCSWGISFFFLHTITVEPYEFTRVVHGSGEQTCYELV